MAALPEVIAEHLEEIRGLCVEHHIRTLTLFGSAARDDFDPQRSDADFLVEFLPNAPRLPWAGNYFRFQEALEGLLGRRVDLVMPGAIHDPNLKKSIYENSVPLYVAA
jgi:predicted nucleotidyltransferase